MQRRFEEDLSHLKSQVLSMAARVERNIGDAIEGLKNKDEALLRDVTQRDPEVDLAEIQIDELCLALLALQQPVARDLRFITTALKIVKDIERIGDMAANMAKHALTMLQLEPVTVPHDFFEASRCAQSMLKRALDAFVNRDADLARRAIEEDDKVDDLHDQIIQHLIAKMIENNRFIKPLTYLMYINKYIERIGDHSANIAEMVVFLVEAKDIRHLEKLQRLRS